MVARWQPGHPFRRACRVGALHILLLWPGARVHGRHLPVCAQPSRESPSCGAADLHGLVGLFEYAGSRRPHVSTAQRLADFWNPPIHSQLAQSAGGHSLPF